MARGATTADENVPLSSNDRPSRAAAGKGKQRVNREDDDEDEAMGAPEESDSEAGDDGNEEEEEMDLDDSGATQTQSMGEQREIRAGYRKLQADLDDARKDLRTVKLGELAENVESAEKLFSRVQNTAEAVLDSRVLLAASDAGALKARQMKVDTHAFDTDDFVRRLARLMDGRIFKKAKSNMSDTVDPLRYDRSITHTQPLKWDRLGRLIGAQSRRIPGINFMYGPLSVEVKQRKKTQRTATQKINPKDIVRPNAIDNTGDPDKERLEMTRLVQRMANVLGKVTGPEQAMPYLAFITNPHSFTETVENMFHFAFLIKEGKAALEVETEGPHAGDLIVFRTEAPDLQEADKGTAEQNHVFEMTDAIWRAAIEAYDIKEPVIQTRYETGPE